MKKAPVAMEPGDPNRLSILIPAVYAAGAGVYIAVSDIVLFDHIGPSLSDDLSLIKGMGFVVVTTLILFLVLRRVFVPGKVYASLLNSHNELVEALPNLVFDIDLEGRLRGWNSQVMRVTGHSPGHLEGRPAVDFIDGSHRDLIGDEIRRLLAGESRGPVEAALLTADGRPVPYLWHSAPNRDARGNVTGLIGIGVDISREKEVEAKLRHALMGSHQALRQTVQAIAHAVELRDSYTSGHQSRVSELAEAIARRMAWPDERVEGLVYGALLHDVGKLALPGDILVKPDRLTDLEYEMVKTHTVHGHEVLKDIDFPWPVADIARHHHERIDGSGYPDGLSGDEILMEAQIVGVADVVEAMTSHRPYRAALGLERALAEIRDGAGTRYNPVVVAACDAVFAAGFKLDAEPKSSVADPADDRD